MGMRLHKAQIAGYFMDQSNPNAWEAVGALSAAASLKSDNVTDEEDESHQES